MASEKLRTDKTCLNCGHQVDDIYCSHCGQKNVELHDSFGHLVRHFIADYFHFDSRFRRSMAPLLFRPGYLPKLYLKGERASHINPIGTLIFLSAVFFILFKNEELNVKVEPLNSASIAQLHAVDNTEVGEDSVLQKQTIDSLRRALTDTTGGAIKQTLQQKVLHLASGGEIQKEIFTEKLKHNFAKVVLALIPLLALILWLVYYRQKVFYFFAPHFGGVCTLFHVPIADYLRAAFIFTCARLQLGIFNFRHLHCFSHEKFLRPGLVQNRV